MPAKKGREETRSSDPQSFAGDGVDRLSSLPDCLLSSILSLLPFQDSARTSVLSTRWRRLWTLAPVDLDAGPLYHQRTRRRSLPSFAIDDGTWCISAVRRILSRHRGPIRSARLDQHVRSCIIPTVDSVIETLARRRVQNLSLRLYFPIGDHLRHHCIRSKHPGYVFPPYLFRCHSLTALELRDCCLEPPHALPCPAFAGLRDLTLTCASLDDGYLPSLLPRCPALQNLALLKCWGLENLCIRSPSLRRLIVTYDAMIANVVVEDAPNLRSMLLSKKVTEYQRVKVVSAPRLELIGFVRMGTKMLQLGNSRFQCGLASNLSTQMHGVKTLAIRVEFN